MEAYEKPHFEVVGLKAEDVIVASPEEYQDKL